MNTTILQPQPIEESRNWLSKKTALGVSPAILMLAGIIALSAFLHLYQLDSIGDANLYYTAAVESMLQSWHNFFFVAAEPGASVTIDKPPLGLWIEAASAFIFGVNGFAVVLPNILAGLLSIPLIYHLGKKYFGTSAGLIAALVIAITPVSIAAQRNNTADGMLTLTLILAAWAFLKATETDKVRFLWLGAVIVGLGFNIKMLQSFLPLPAFYAVYFLGAKAGVWRKIGNLLIATVILLAVSLSWAIAVDLTPADQRPYIGSSSDNTVMELIVGHNGASRLFGGGLRRNDGRPDDQPGQFSPPDDGQFAPPNDDQQAPNNFGSPPQNGGQQPGVEQQPPGGNNFGLPTQDGHFTPPNGGQPPTPPNGGPDGNSEVGESGTLRFFEAPLSKEMSWLLPFALIAGLLVLLRKKLRWPISRKHQMMVIWGGWLAIGMIFFSFAGLFHAYYLVMLAPPLAILMGAGVSEMWQMRRGHPRLAAGILVATAVSTLTFQWYNATQFISLPIWLPVAAIILLAGVGLVLWSWSTRQAARLQQLAFAIVLTALMITPLAWSALTTLDTSNVNLPGGYQGETANGGLSNAKRTADSNLLSYLEANTQDVEYLMAVGSSMQGAEYVIASGRPVLYMGGFSGGDPVVDADDISQMVADGELRYILLGGNNRGGQQEIVSWVQGSCVVVDGVGLETAPTSSRGQAVSSIRPSQTGSPGGNNAVALYQCDG
ncbi:MAG: dolichyl-phosphate-mannose--protein mannosyltransferase [Chloroflexi bacterium]|nr:dolichyl-phosphate-mannose--protein mannosyltransferase [Chloroflexota bacterium]